MPNLVTLNLGYNPMKVPLNRAFDRLSILLPRGKIISLHFWKNQNGPKRNLKSKVAFKNFWKKNGHFLSFSREDLPLKMIIFVPISFQFWFGLAEKNIYFDARRLDCCQLCANMSAHFAFSTARKIAFGSWPCSI